MQHLIPMMSSIASGVHKIPNQAAVMVLSSLMSDAACMPLHWIYDQETVQAKVDAAGGRAAFFHTPSCPFYTYPVGVLSPYGDEGCRSLKFKPSSLNNISSHSYLTVHGGQVSFYI